MTFGRRMIGVGGLVLVCLAAAPTLTRAAGTKLAFHFGPAGTQSDNGATVVSDGELYDDHRGYGWLPAEPETYRFNFHETFDDPSRVAREAIKLDSAEKLFSDKYPGFIGAGEVNKPGELVYKLNFPSAPVKLVLRDENRMWWGKGGYVRCSVSRDGQAWQVLYDHKTRPGLYDSRYDLSKELAGQTQLFVKYEFSKGSSLGGADKKDPRTNSLSSFSVQGVLAGKVPQDFKPERVPLQFATGAAVDGAFKQSAESPAGNGVIILDEASFAADLPKGSYYVEVRSGATPISLAADGKPIISRQLPWRISGKAKQETQTVGGIVEHTGGKLVLAIEAMGAPADLLGVRILPADGVLNHAQWQGGELVLTTPSDDPAVQAGLKVLADGGWILTPQVSAAAVHEFAKVKDASLVAELVALGGLAPGGYSRQDAIAKTVRSTLIQMQKASPDNVTVSLVLDDVERLVLGEGRYDYEHEPWTEIAQDSPLFAVAQFRLARVKYNDLKEIGLENEGGPKLKQELDAYMQQPLAKYAKDPTVKVYDGQQVPWGSEYEETDPTAPRWAVMERELMGRYQHIIHWWVENRQQPDGDFFARAGQGFNDSVEMMRLWTVSGIALNDPKSITSATRLADAIWESSEFKYGFSEKYGDIQHTSEEQSDAEPWLISLHYGDPEYFERNLLALSLMRDVWTAKNANGHRHFKSAWISATDGTPDTPGHGVDVPYAARAAKMGHWVSWYAGLGEAKSLMTEWSAAWAEDSLRTDRGKPKGVPPAAISFSDEVLGGHGKSWYDPDLRWTYFIYPGATGGIYDQMLLGYELTGDKKYVEPHAETVKLVQQYADAPGDDAPGGPAWVVKKLLPVNGKSSIFSALEKWRLVTGDNRFDSVFAKYGSGYVRYRIDGETSALEQDLERALQHLRNNLPMMTDEVWYLDRVPLDCHQLLFAMLTGQEGSETYAPIYNVTYDNPGTEFAALVQDAGKDKLKLTAFSFEEQPKTLGLFTWELYPGKYSLIVSSKGAAAETKEITVQERGQRFEVVLPPHREMNIEFKPIDIDRKEAVLPDLAIAARDIKFDTANLASSHRIRMNVTVHSIGADAAHDCHLRVFPAGGDGAAGTQAIADVSFADLPAPDGLKPIHKELSADWAVPEGMKAFRVEVSCAGRQVTTRNDQVTAAFAK